MNTARNSAVLLVEDNSDDVFLMRRAFEKAPHEFSLTYKPGLLWRTTCNSSLRIGDADSGPTKEGANMKNLTTKMMIAAAAFVAVAGVASLAAGGRSIAR